MPDTIRRMTCAVCGSDAGRWAQWHNRDTGFGLCLRCVGWLRNDRKMPAEELRRLYGVAGVNFSCEDATP
jgi:hypothetical protein